MNDAKFAAYLLKELPTLTASGVLDSANASALQRHYAANLDSNRANAVACGITISAVLGVLLIGSGIILLIGHNWDDLSRSVRAALAMLPLLAAAAVTTFALLRRPGSVAWRESTSLFYFLFIGAAIALISQTYHFYNDLQGFLTVWMLFGLPLVYVLGSGTAFIGVLVCLVSLNFHRGSFGLRQAQDFSVWAWMLALLPFYAWLLWRRRELVLTTWLSAALAVAGLLLLLGFTTYNRFYFWHLAFPFLFALYYTTGCRFFSEFPAGWRNPLRAAGALGIAVVAVILSFGSTHKYASWVDFDYSLSAVVWMLLVLVAVAVLCVSLVRREIKFNALAVAFPLVVAIATLAPPGGSPEFLLNFYLLALGVFMLVRGVRSVSLSAMNEGMVLIAMLIACRFFDSDYDFVVRGVAFILIGAAFLAVNLRVLHYRRKQSRQGQ